jgi:hypothetical protein
MTSFLILLAGMFIGWNVPQPAIARTFQYNVLKLFKDIASNPSDDPPAKSGRRT